MKLQSDQNLPLYQGSDEYQKRLYQRLTDAFRKITQQLNLLTEGKVEAVHNAYTAAPTTGTWLQGDFIRNSAPTEAGTAGSKYVVMGWLCVASGTPGTWMDARCLTGN